MSSLCLTDRSAENITVINNSSIIAEKLSLEKEALRHHSHDSPTGKTKQFQISNFVTSIHLYHGQSLRPLPHPTRSGFCCTKQTFNNPRSCNHCLCRWRCFLLYLDVSAANGAGRPREKRKKGQEKIKKEEGGCNRS